MSAQRVISVAAGAGTGKTYSLTEHFVSLALSGVPVSEILTITFTELAAAEMRERIIHKLDEIGRHAQRREVEFAVIGTIHALCARILRENALVAGLDPGFGVANEDRARLLFEKAFQAADQRFRVERPQQWDALRGSVGVAGNRPSLLRREDQWVVAFQRLYGSVRQLDDWGLGWMEVSEKGNAPLLNLLIAAEKALEELEHAPDKYDQRRSELGAVLERLVQIDPDELRPEIFTLFESIRHAVKGNVIAKLKEPFNAVKDALDQARLFVADRLAARTVPVQLFIEDYLVKEYEGVKRRAGLLDFDDLESKAVALLAEDQGLRERLQRRWTQILVDEFQDTSPIQNRLVELLSDNSGLFVVGDEKQAIYGFRGSDVEVIRRVHESTPEQGRRTLKVNRRSRPEILAFANLLFERMWDTDRNTRNRMERLEPWDEKQWPERCGVRIRLGVSASSDTRRFQEARWVAQSIESLISQAGFWDFERPVEPGSIAVLARTTGGLGPIQRALAERSIPFDLISGDGYFESWEVLDLANLLRCIVDERDEIRLAAVLRSPLVGLSDQGLLELCLHARDTRISLLEALADLRATERLESEVDRRAVEDFARRHAMLRQRSRHLRADALLAQAAELFEAELTALAAVDGRRKAANVRRLTVLATELVSSGIEDPLKLADELVRLRATRSRAVEPTTPDSDQRSSVRLMTVHKAKGLEFDVVFVVDVGRSPKGPSETFKVSRKLGAAFKLVDPRSMSVISDDRWKLVKDALKRESDDEEQRLLYVAMTRAKDLLVLSGTRTKKKQHWLGSLAQELELPDEPGEGAIELNGCRPAVWSVVDLDAEQGAELEDPQREEPLSAVAVELEPVADRAPAPQPRLDVISATGLWTFDRCPRRFELGYMLCMPLDQPRDEEPSLEDAAIETPLVANSISGVAWGQAVHLILERIELDGTGDQRALAQLVLEQLDLEPDTATIDRLAGVAADFLHSPIGMQVGAAQNVLREHSVALRWGSLLIEGKIDLAFDSGDGWVLVDHKTDRPPQGDPRLLAERYRSQLLVYRQALAGALGNPPLECRLNCVGRAAVKVEFEDPAGDLDALVVRLNAAVQSSEFPRSQGEYCAQCRQRRLCLPGSSA
ncbi:MAG: UvrD-helicase domain-containing protein [Candidatus Alcyoniella australis]|nr:UvrD-helicase domain-containing protein [Candidatus Alcyoniella australis]